MEKVAIFDLDGTVLDTQEDIADCMNKTIELFGYKKRSYAEYKQVIGNDASNFMRKLLGDLPTEKLMEIWCSYEKVYDRYGIVKTKLFDGINEVLIALKERGYKLSLLTNKTPEELAPFIPVFFTNSPFDDIIGVGNTDGAKPSPKEVLRILSDFYVEKENAYLIGDGETDILAAVNAKITPIAVLWGNRTKEQLKAVGANIFVDTPKEILDILK